MATVCIGRFVLGPFAFASLLSLAGCAGAKEQIVDEPAVDPGASEGEGQDAATSAPSTADDAGSSGNGSVTGSGNGSGNGNGAGSGSGSGNGNGGGGGSSIGTPAPSTCPPNAVTEDGSNDKRYTAITFTSDACGAVGPLGDDWWKFTLPSTATKFAFQYSGKVAIEVMIQGETIAVGFGSSGNAIPFRPGAEYEVQVTSATNDTESYVLDVEDE